MAEPFGGSGTVPMLDAGRNLDDVPRKKFARLFSPGLIIAAAPRRQKDLPAAVVDVPMIATSRLKCDIGDDGISQSLADSFAL